MKNKIFTIAVLFIFLLSSRNTNAQQCCAGFDLNSSQSWCLANLNPCTVGTTCSGAALEAAHGLGVGNWVGLQCTGGPADCSASCTPGNTDGLPVELVDFKVKYKDNSMELHWATASELNNEGFEIEHSTDGINWRYLDFVEGHGTTSVPQHYDYLDRSPVLGFNYYRLKQMDFDGAYEYSPMQVAIWQGSTDSEKLEMAVLPNPAANWITTALPNTIQKEANIQFHIYDQVGRLVKTKIIAPESQIRIEIDELTEGFYILQANQSNFQYSTTFIKK